jgi:hypothetical protein
MMEYATWPRRACQTLIGVDADRATFAITGRVELSEGVHGEKAMRQRPVLSQRPLATSVFDLKIFKFAASIS